MLLCIIIIHYLKRPTIFTVPHFTAFYYCFVFIYRSISFLQPEEAALLATGGHGLRLRDVNEVLDCHMSMCVRNGNKTISQTVPLLHSFLQPLRH